MATLRYDQLNDPDEEIRLLQVLPRDSRPGDAEGGEDNDILICNLLTATRGKNCPKYTALSYAWGQHAVTKMISINGMLCHVNETVEMALREIRRHAGAASQHKDESTDLEEQTTQHEGELVWVDQICINQADESEKGHQVNQMRHIYSEADHVIAWVGASWPDCGFLFEHFTEVGEALTLGDFNLVWDLHRDEKTRKRLARAYFEYCKRQYWTRLWVIQEYAVARKLTIACGPWRLDALHVHSVIVPDAEYFPSREAEDESMEKDGDSAPENRDDILRDYRPLLENIPSSFVLSILTRREGYQWPFEDESAVRVNLFTMLATALVLETDYNLPQTSDPRDRIFSLMGLTSDQADFEGFPDYSRSCEEIYQRAAEVMLRKGQVDVLAYCQFPRNFPELPSWAPDWSMGLRAPCCVVAFETEFRACGSTNAEGRVQIAGDEIKLSGVFVDTIKERSTVLWDPDWLKGLDVDAAREYVNEIGRYCSKSPRIRVEDERDDVGRIAIAEYGGQHSDITWDDYFALIRYGLRTLQDDSSENGEAAEQPQSPLQEVEQGSHPVDHVAEGVAQISIQGGNGDDGADETLETEQTMLATDPIWFRESLRRLHSRRPFITTTGFVGLCPEHTEPGDQVFVLLGARTPYVLRPADDGVRYKVVGDAYVHGIMYGEMLKGEPEVVDMAII